MIRDTIATFYLNLSTKDDVLEWLSLFWPGGCCMVQYAPDGKGGYGGHYYHWYKAWLARVEARRHPNGLERIGY